VNVKVNTAIINQLSPQVKLSVQIYFVQTLAVSILLHRVVFSYSIWIGGEWFDKNQLLHCTTL
jgi:hypothetical protein